MPIGVAYQRHLTKEAQDALQSAGDVLVDTLFTDLASILAEKRPVHETAFAEYLPPKHLPKYTPVFCKRWFTCVLTVMWKLAQPLRLRLSCTGEELAAYVLLQEAQAQLDLAGEADESLDDATIAGAQEGLDYLHDALFEDWDYVLLYEAAYDGVETSGLAREAGFANLSLADWFQPFGTPENRMPPHIRYTAVHPYIEDDPPDQHSPDLPHPDADREDE